MNNKFKEFAKHLTQLNERMTEIGIPQDYWTPERVSNFVSHGWVLKAVNLGLVECEGVTKEGIHVLLINPQNPTEVL